MHDPSFLPGPVAFRDWRPDLPDGDLRTIWLHWTAGDYETTFGAYHFCLSGARAVVVHATHDLRANMRSLRDAPGPYAAHTAGRNSHAIGIAICAMRDAAPDDFGTAPLTAEQIEALCGVTAVLARRYGIDGVNIRTHAEAALADGYFGAGSDDLRWDIARLAPSPLPLRPDEATRVGDRLRARITAYR